jgi:hypothetical protein
MLPPSSGSMFLRNVGKPEDYMAQELIRPQYKTTPPWKITIAYDFNFPAA